jgi:hypothetical protein
VAEGVPPSTGSRRSSVWPAAFLLDKPGISVEGKLFPIEDDFRWSPFSADVAFYLLVLLGLGRGRRQLRQIRPTGDPDRPG